MIKRRKFVLGVRSKPTNIPTADNGDISVSSVDNKLKITTYTYASYVPLQVYSIGEKVRFTDGYNYVCIQATTGAENPNNAAFWQVYEQSVVTEDQTQTLINKSIDADTNPISNIETDNLKAGVLNTSTTLAGATDTQIPSALAVKTALEAQNEASEIDFAPITNVAGPKVQDAIGQVQGNLQSHIDSLTAHDSANIDYDPTISGLTATKVKPAIDELDLRLDTAESSLTTTSGKVDDLVTLSGVAANSQNLGTFTGTTIPDNTTVKPALQSLETQAETTANDLGTHVAATAAHGAIGAVVGTNNVQTLSFKTYQDARFDGVTSYVDEVISSTGVVSFLNPSKSLLYISGAVTEIQKITSATFSTNERIVLVNQSGGDIIIRNKFGTNDGNQIKTGLDDDLTLAPEASLMLQYRGDGGTAFWYVVGGTGGGSVEIKLTAGETVALRSLVAIDGTDGKAYYLDPANDDRIEFVGFTKDFALINDPAKIVTSGVLKGFSGLTPGLPVYADPITAGSYTQTEPSNNIFNNKWVIRVGIAISATQILINPDQASSAYFKVETSSSVTIANNQAVAANVTDLILDGAEVRSALVEYSLYRKTDTNEVLQSGIFRVQYKPIEMTWLLGAESYLGDNAGVTFSITSGGQVQYVSDDLTGTNYVGNLKYNVSQLFNV